LALSIQIHCAELLAHKRFPPWTEWERERERSFQPIAGLYGTEKLKYATTKINTPKQLNLTKPNK